MPGLLGGGKQAAELLMDYASRMQRAKDMGFDTDRVWYHGGQNDIDAFQIGRRPAYFAEDPAIADIYAENASRRWPGDNNATPNVTPVYLRGPEYRVSDLGEGGGGWWRDNAAKELGIDLDSVPVARQAQALRDEIGKRGFNRIAVTDMDDLGGKQTQYLVSDPSNIRSINAAFDPAKRDSPDLLAGIGGAAVLGGGLLGSGEAEASFFGPLAKTADKAALALAEKLKAEGADPKQILQNTGWFQGVDGKWRFEVDDRAMELGGGADRAMSGPLEGVVRHDELFRAYPDMRGIEASYRPAAGTADSDVLGSYTPFEDRGSDYFPIYEEIQMAGRNDDEVRRGLLHEMQHAVQQREGFAAGGSPRDELLRIKDERYSAEERLKEANAETSKISELLDNIRTLKNPEKREKLLADYGERYNAALARKQKLAQLDGHLFDDRQVREIAFDRYRSGPGEVEARNVEARADLTPEQRAAKPPWETEDTTRTKQRAHMGSADVGLLGLLGSAGAAAMAGGKDLYNAAGNAAGTLLQAPETAMRGWRGLLSLPQGIDKAAQQARTDTDDLNYQLGGQVTDAMTPLFGTKAAPMMGYGAYLLPQFLSPF